MEGKKNYLSKSYFGKEEAVYKDILGKYEDIRMSKQKMASLPSQKTYSQRMEIGRMVELALQKKREIYKEDIFRRPCTFGCRCRRCIILMESS